MYSFELIEIYMKTKGYSQAKQAASDLGLSSALMTRIKNNERNLPEESAIYIAERCGLDVTEVLIKLQEEKAKTTTEKNAWANALKKYNQRALEAIEGFATSLKANLINFA